MEAVQGRHRSGDRQHTLFLPLPAPAPWTCPLLSEGPGQPPAPAQPSYHSGFFGSLFSCRIVQWGHSVAFMLDGHINLIHSGKRIYKY